MMRCVIAVTPDAPGMGYVANAWIIIAQTMNCRHAILIKKLKRPMTGQ
jgi:hypothetical protein